MIPRNEAFRYIPEERMITDRERRHIDKILSHPLETDDDLLSLDGLVYTEAPADPRTDHGLQP